jgi:hypothetical protein
LRVNGCSVLAGGRPLVSRGFPVTLLAALLAIINPQLKRSRSLNTVSFIYARNIFFKKNIATPPLGDFLF